MNSTICKQDTERTDIAIIICAVYLLTTAILSIVGNLIVLLAIHNSTRLREQPSSVFVANLSICDLLNAVFVILPTTCFIIKDNASVPNAFCNIQCALNYVFIIVSMLSLAMIAVERWVSVSSPFKHMDIMRNRTVMLMTSCTWIQGLAFGCVPIICSWVMYDYWEAVCAITWDAHADSGGVEYVVTAFILCFAVPSVLMIACYGKILAIVQRKDTHRHRLQQKRNEDMRIIKSILAVVIVFFVCMTPFCITKLIKIFFSTCSIPSWVNLFSSLAQFTSSATNPWIYGVFREDFRYAVRKTFWKLYSAVPCGSGDLVRPVSQPSSFI
ncbi:G-protein coupled receptor 26-like [Anneissia japonica]|uniref:G-protein coupled receptor 26-like n=1 Tax=Anneissia japonica TaxID=1529436 RepID=UPI0014259B63|nr:G-protein coupled receptor 26-like [Anneissia japonica]